MPRGKIPAKHNPYKSVGVVAGAGFTIGAEDSNAITVNVQLNDIEGNPLSQRASLRAYISDDANGDSVAATAPDGGVAGGTDGVVTQLVTGKQLALVSEADGDIDVVITHTAGAKTCYLVLVMPDASLVVSGAITFQ